MCATGVVLRSSFRAVPERVERVGSRSSKVRHFCNHLAATKSKRSKLLMLRPRIGWHVGRVCEASEDDCGCDGQAMIPRSHQPASSSTTAASTSPTMRKQAPPRQTRSFPHWVSDKQPGSSGAPRTQEDAPATRPIARKSRRTPQRQKRMRESSSAWARCCKDIS